MPRTDRASRVMSGLEEGGEEAARAQLGDGQLHVVVIVGSDAVGGGRDGTVDVAPGAVRWRGVRRLVLPGSKDSTPSFGCWPSATSVSPRVGSCRCSTSRLATPGPGRVGGRPFRPVRPRPRARAWLHQCSCLPGGSRGRCATPSNCRRPWPLCSPGPSEPRSSVPGPRAPGPRLSPSRWFSDPPSAAGPRSRPRHNGGSHHARERRAPKGPPLSR